MKINRLVLILGLLANLNLYAQNEPFVSMSVINWDTGELIIDISSQMISTSTVLPENRLNTERAIDRSLATNLREEFFAIQLDSQDTIGTWVSEKPTIFRRLEELRETMEKRFTQTSEDALMLTVRYSMDIFPSLIDLFVEHMRPNPVPKTLVWTPTRAFTGIVIYVPSDLDWVSSRSDSAELQKALFPRIHYREEGIGGGYRVLWSRDMVLPEYLSRWGMVAYRTGFDESVFEERIGLDPLRLMAREIYGENATDIVLTQEDARTIMYSPENRALLEQGRVLILLDQ